MSIRRRLGLRPAPRFTATTKASSAESVEPVWLGELSEAVIQRDLRDPEAAVAVRFSGDQFRLVIEALDGARRDGALGGEPVEDELAMATEHARDPLHRLD